MRDTADAPASMRICPHQWIAWEIELLCARPTRVPAKRARFVSVFDRVQLTEMSDRCYQLLARCIIFSPELSLPLGDGERYSRNFYGSPWSMREDKNAGVRYTSRYGVLILLISNLLEFNSDIGAEDNFRWCRRCGYDPGRYVIDRQLWGEVVGNFMVHWDSSERSFVFREECFFEGLILEKLDAFFIRLLHK